MKLEEKVDISGMNILVVDDNSKNLQVIGNILKEFDFKLSFSLSSNKALESIHRKKPDLILLDVKMPGMSGFELCQILRDTPETEHIPVIFITALKTDEDSLIEGFHLGAVDYLKKPFKQSELVARIQNHLYSKAYRDRLELLIQEKNRMFSIFVHDIKNPFSSILGITELAVIKKDSIKREKLLEMMDYINTSGSNIIQLLEDLEFTIGSHSDTITVSPEKVSVDQTVDKILKLFDQAINAKKISIDFSHSDLYMNVDRFMIETVIRNTINNAIKYTNNAGEIKISSHLIDNNVVIRIKDTGIGMDEETIENLLKNTINTSTEGTDNEKGTGLGVGICKEMIRKNNGEFYIESTPGEGTTISFSVSECNES